MIYHMTDSEMQRLRQNVDELRQLELIGPRTYAHTVVTLMRRWKRERRYSCPVEQELTADITEGNRTQ